MEPATFMLYFLVPTSIVMIFCGYKIFRGNWGYLSGEMVHPEQPSEQSSVDLEKEREERMKRRRKIVGRIFSSKSSTSLSSDDEGDDIPRVLVYDNETAKYEWQPKNDSNVTSNECSICLEDFDSECEIVTPACSHSFHRECILHWIGKNRDTCPTCRTTVWDQKEYDRLDNELKQLTELKEAPKEHSAKSTEASQTPDATVASEVLEAPATTDAPATTETLATTETPDVSEDPDTIYDI